MKVKKIKQKLDKREDVIKLPQDLKQNLTSEIIELLKGLNGGANATLQHGKFIFCNFTCDDGYVLYIGYPRPVASCLCQNHMSINFGSS